MRPTKTSTSPPALATVRSATWATGPAPRIAVVIPTHQRAGFLPSLVAALEAQRLPAADFEVVLVDDASQDDTWAVASASAERTSLRLTAVRQAENRGAAAARNLGVGYTRAPMLAFTDDDCLPTPGWLAALLDELESGAAVVQGRVGPPPEDWKRAGEWAHTIWVGRPSPFFQTCNVGYPRARFEAVGGFDDRDPFFAPEGRRHFGEDADLGWRVLREGGERRFAASAMVHHRVLDGDVRGWLRGQRRTAGFPGLARRSPLFAQQLRLGVFLSWRSASFDVASAASLAAVVSRRGWLLGATLPWVALRGRDALRQVRGRRSRAPLVLAQHAVGDLVTLVSLLEGSVRHRRLIL